MEPTYGEFAAKCHRSSNLQITIYTYAGQWIYLCQKVTEFTYSTAEMEVLIDQNDGTR